jgi:[glutamine synthetase] adenylyltransferase / [glutamine synthetase]-adenylyl-L-tyrosine phosphorylase
VGEAGDDYEALLDRVRRRVGELRFALGVQLIEGARDPLEIAAALARVAEAAVTVLAGAASLEFRRRHGAIAGSELVVLGLGRIGGGLLTHASDLDLVYLFTGEALAESDGPRPLGPALYYNRLGQRVSAALSVPTAEGALYEVDTRLRPSGEQGPLAVSCDAFARYQAEQAWTWEHMALCRARVLHGSAAAREDLRRIVCEVLQHPRDPGRLREEVLEMRARMAQHKPPRGPLDVKLLRGGLVDCEFLVHFVQLRDGREVPGALVPGVGEAIDRLAAAGRLPAGLRGAHDALTRILVAMRLLAPEGEVPGPAARAALAKACGYGDWQALEAALAEARAQVVAAWAQGLGEQLEVNP